MRLPGTPTIQDQCADILRRSPGLPATLVAARLGRSIEIAHVQLNRMVAAGKVLKHTETRTDSPYYGRIIYYLAELKA